MTWHVGVSGSHHEVVDNQVGVGGTWRQVVQRWVGVGGVWKPYWPYAAVPSSPAWAAGYPKDDPVTDTHALLRLQAATNADSYRVFFRVGASMAGDPEANADGYLDLTEAQVISAEYDHDTGESAGTTIYYQAAALNTLGLSAFNTEQSVTLVLAPPTSAPAWAATYPKDNAADDDGVLAKFVAVGDASTYDLFYRYGASMAGDPEANADGSVTGLTAAQIVSAAYNLATGQSHGTVVYLQGRGVNAGGNGPFNTEATATVSMRAPGDPADVTASDNGDGTAELTVTPGSPDSATIYRFLQYYRTSPSGGWTADGSFTDADGYVASRPMVEGRQYYWSVRAENAGGNSSYVDSNTIQYVDTPGTPTGVNLDYDGTNPDSELIGSCTAPVGGGSFDGYEWEVVPYASSFTGTATHTSSGTSKRFTGLGDDTRHKVQVRAVSSVWSTEGSWGGPADEWTAPSTLSAPTLTVTATGDDTLHLDASTPPDVDEYAFYDSGGSLLVQQAGDTYDRTGLSANTQYGQYVKAVNKASVGSPHSDTYSAASATNNKYTLVDVPQSFSATRDNGACPTNQFDLAWSNNNGDAVARSTSGTIQRDDGAGYSSVGTFSAGATAANGVAATATTVGFRIKYDGESTYAADTSLGPPCPE